MSVKFKPLKTFLTKYASAYRARYELDDLDPVVQTFVANNTAIYIIASVPEYLSIKQGNFWWNGQDLFLCQQLIPDNVQGTQNTYSRVIGDDAVPVGTEVVFQDLFKTQLQPVGENLDLSIPPSQQPRASASIRGSLQVHNGSKYVDLPPGPDMHTLISDPLAELGLRWSPAGGDVGDITWRGNWNSTVPYRNGDVVRHLDETWVSLGLSQNKEPPDVTSWSIFVGRGAVGPPGQQGAVGPVGQTGFDWQGDFDPGRTLPYPEGAAVFHEGASYRSRTLTLQEPPHPDWDLLAGGAGDAVVKSYMAYDAISAFRVVASNDVGKIAHADARTLDHRYRVLGISKQAAVPGDVIQVIMTGYISSTHWNLIRGIPVFLGEDGLITQDPAGLVGRVFTMIVGTPITDVEMKVEINLPILTV